MPGPKPGPFDTARRRYINLFEFMCDGIDGIFAQGPRSLVPIHSCSFILQFHDKNPPPFLAGSVGVNEGVSQYLIVNCSVVALRRLKRPPTMG